MPYINLQLSEKQMEHTNSLAKKLKLSRAAYIRQAIEAFNQRTKRKILAEQFGRASRKCRQESLKVCREFESADAALEEL